MKAAIIGANGKLGSCITKQALDQGWDVVGFINQGTLDNEKVTVVEKSLFDLTKEDLKGIDAVFSAFGGGFHADPVINEQAYEKYAALIKETGIRFITIAGAGSLYTDASHTMREFEMPGYPEVLAKISMNIFKGQQYLKQSGAEGWTAVCPSRKFDFEGPFSNAYQISAKEEVGFNQDGNSYVTYNDLAAAMIKIAETGEYQNQVVTIISDHGE